MIKKKNDTNKNNGFSWKKMLMFLFMIWIATILISAVFFSDTDAVKGNVAVIPIKGVISSSSGSGLFTEEGAVPDTIISFIDDAEKNPSIKAVVFEINSGGGSPVASDEIAQRIDMMEKPNVAYIRDIGASGAYWIAVSSDHIMANRMSLVGSIGVTAAYLSFEGLMEKYNITYNRVVAGKYKDMGSPTKELTGEERSLFDDLLFELRDEFIYQVAANRNMDHDAVEALATGQVWTGKTGLELGLVDSLGSEKELTEYLENELNTTVSYHHYKKEVTLRDLFTGVVNDFGFSIGKGASSSLINTENNIRIS